MSTYDLGQGFIERQIDPTNPGIYQSWVAGFPTYRTQKLKQLLSKHKLEASEFVALTSVIDEVPHPEVRAAAHLFDFYKAYLPVRDLTNNKDYAIPFLAIFSKGERASSSDFAIPTSLAEMYAIQHFFPDALCKVIGLADISKTRMSTNMTSEQLSTVIQSYKNPNLYKHIVVHFMGLGFINSVLALLGRVSPETKVVASKVMVASNMDMAINVLADTIKNLIRSSES